MSTLKTEKQAGKKSNLFKKDITFKIREDIISKQFILRAIKSVIEKNDDFEKGLMVKSPLGDSMVMTIKKENKEIVISTKHDNDITLNIKGDSELIKKFVHDITLEAVSTVASQFAGCIIRAKNPNFSIETFHQNLQKHLHHALHTAIEESIAEKIE